MSLDKAIISGKEHRKPYRGAKSVDYMCRNHGICFYCSNNRLFHVIKATQSADSKLADEDYTYYVLKKAV